MLFSLYNSVEESFELFGSEIDLKQIFEIVKSAKEESSIWIIVKSPFTNNKHLAVAVAALAQTKVSFLFFYFFVSLSILSESPLRSELSN